MARTAQIRERTNAVMVVMRTLWMNVLFVPFQTPQAPSAVHRCERTVIRDELGGKWCAMAEERERVFRDDRDLCGEGDPEEAYRVRRGRGWREAGAVVVKYEGESGSEWSDGIFRPH